MCIYGVAIMHSTIQQAISYRSEIIVGLELLPELRESKLVHFLWRTMHR